MIPNYYVHRQIHTYQCSKSNIIQFYMFLTLSRQNHIVYYFVPCFLLNISCLRFMHVCMPLCENSIIYLLIFPQRDIWVVFSFSLLQTMHICALSPDMHMQIFARLCNQSRIPGYKYINLHIPGQLLPNCYLKWFQMFTLQPVVIHLVISCSL